MYTLALKMRALSSMLIAARFAFIIPINMLKPFLLTENHAKLLTVKLLDLDVHIINFF
ncbi:hypothetical protein J2S17_002388 [Cytobacillus purgationiresistens]|uniref:Uncharacterized protein n=1 Tax=Cytobacillus purgationiresistens TaxID=863449 RepID=A0ABU0AJC4_9BACI|nr:hypothetical protein [Cytobacillus purgationiresistens]